jgi:hypothetical protein
MLNNCKIYKSVADVEKIREHEENMTKEEMSLFLYGEHINQDDQTSWGNVYPYSPFIDGSARELLVHWKKQNNLKAVAPGQLRKMYCLFRSGCKELPRDLLMSVPTGEGQYALMMSWYKLLEVDRPCVRAKNRVKPEQVRHIRELREMGYTYDEIHGITHVPPTTIHRYSNDIIKIGNPDKYNIISKEKYGKYFCHLNKVQQRLIVEIIGVGNNV